MIGGRVRTRARGAFFYKVLECMFVEWNCKYCMPTLANSFSHERVFMATSFSNKDFVFELMIWGYE